MLNFLRKVKIQYTLLFYKSKINIKKNDDICITLYWLNFEIIYINFVERGEKNEL